jgi:hypothetical protein
MEVNDALLVELTRETKKLAQPIDFADLESRGVVSKEGTWYRVHNWRDLPEHAVKKIYELAQDRKGTKVKFEKSSKFEKLAKRFEDAAAKKLR